MLRLPRGTFRCLRNRPRYSRFEAYFLRMLDYYSVGDQMRVPGLGGGLKSDMPTLAIGWLAIWLSGCTATDIGTIQSTPFDQGLVLSRDLESQAYIISDNDELTVRFYFNPNLDEDVRVRPDGKISLSLVGELQAAGLSPDALSAEITQAYGKYLVKPTAVVLLRRFADARAFFAGEVNKPGIVDMNNGRQTVLQGIATVGGVTDNATLKDVVLIRRIPGRSQPIVMELNLIHALEGAETAQDVTLLPNDFIYVPRSGAASVNLAMHLYILNNLNLGTSFSAVHAF
jgi:polysaccharide export outer membrane protein